MRKTILILTLMLAVSVAVYAGSKSKIVIPPFPSMASLVPSIMACSATECENDGEDWCLDNKHGDTQVETTYSEVNGLESTSCFVICDDGYMVLISEDCSAADDVARLHRVVVMSNDHENRVWVEFDNPNGEKKLRLFLHDG